MKKNLTRALAALVALLVFCVPMAMADELQLPDSVNVTFALSNIHLQMGEEVDATVDVTAQLDVAADTQSGAVAGTLTALSGSNKAIKGGFAFDPASLNLTAALEGATDAVLLPMGEILEQLQAQMGEALAGEDMDKIQNLLNAAMNMAAVAENSDPSALAEIVMNWVAEQITAAEEGVSLEVDGMTITADQYDFEVTAQELVALGADLIKTVQSDPDLTAAIQAYIDAIIDLSGEEAAIDLANLDVDALLAEMPEDEVMTIAGSLYVNGEEGHVVLDTEISVTEYDETTTMPYQFILLNKGETTYAGVYTEIEQYGELTSVSVDVNATNDDKPVFDVTVAQNTTGDGSEESTIFTLTVDGSDGANITVYVENSSSFSYNEQSYKSLTAFGANYLGDVVSDDSGTAAMGTLTLYMNQDGQEITVATDILAALTADNNVDFDMPNNFIDLTQADSDTMDALGQEYMEILSQGAMMLMGAPGMESLAPLFGGMLG